MAAINIDIKAEVNLRRVNILWVIGTIAFLYYVNSTTGSTTLGFIVYGILTVLVLALNIYATYLVDRANRPVRHL